MDCLSLCPGYNPCVWNYADGKMVSSNIGKVILCQQIGSGLGHVTVIFHGIQSIQTICLKTSVKYTSKTFPPHKTLQGSWGGCEEGVAAPLWELTEGHRDRGEDMAPCSGWVNEARLCEKVNEQNQQLYVSRTLQTGRGFAHKCLLAAFWKFSCPDFCL